MDLPCTLYVDHRRLFYRAFQQNWSAPVSFNLLKIMIRDQEPDI
jgi:hypothetical protein